MKFALLTTSIYLFTITFFSFIQLDSCNDKTDYSIKAINVLYHVPVPIKHDGETMNLEMAYEVYYAGDINLYKFFYSYDSMRNDELLLSEKRQYFFAFHKDSSYGHLYDFKNFRSDWQERILVDSVLKGAVVNGSSLDSLSDFKPDSSFYDKEGNFVRSYTPEIRQRQIKATFFLYYNKNLSWIRQTFSKKMDNVKNMKLFKFKVIPYDFKDGMFILTSPTRHIYCEIKEIFDFDHEMISSYFNKYKNSLK